VSCQTVDQNANPTFSNVRTADVAASPPVMRDIDDTVSLPGPCLAPSVFVARGGPDVDRWFASTGQ
jgi:hypothetical protein